MHEPTIALTTEVHAPASEPTMARVEILDIIRGFTLAGILLANMLWFNGFFELAPKYRQPLLQSGTDQWVVAFTRLFVHGKFYSIFAFLFGLGFANLLSKHAASNTTRLLRRRLWALFAIGVAHSLIWWGDIVRYYALIGFTLFYFQRLSNRQLVLWVVLLSLTPLLIELLRALLIPGYENYRFLRVAPKKWLRFVQNASFMELWLANIQMMGDHLIKNLWNGRFFKILSLFLLGLLAGRMRLFEQLPRFSHWLLPSFLISGALGLLGNAFITSIYYHSYAFEAYARDAVKEMVELIAVPALSLAYICGLLLAAQRLTWLRVLAPAGRMSFSNYLGQTLLCIVIFRPYFFGFYAKLSLSGCVLIACVIFFAQVLFSKLWLAHFRFGPVEWLLRSFTLGRAQAFRARG